MIKTTTTLRRHYQQTTNDTPIAVIVLRAEWRASTFVFSYDVNVNFAIVNPLTPEELDITSYVPRVTNFDCGPSR